MKKIILFILMIVLSITNVYAIDIEVEDINISDHSSTISLGDYGIVGNSINADIRFNKLNDFVTYEIKLKNNDEYTIESISDNNDSEYVKTKYVYEESLDKPVYLTLSYNKLLENDLSLDNINVVIKLVSNKGKEEVLEVKVDNSNDIIKISPNTRASLSVILSVLSISLVGFIYFWYYKKKKKMGVMVLVLGILFVPVWVVLADSSDISFVINVEKITVYDSPWEILSSSETDHLSAGDEVAIGTEHFYVVSSDKEKTILLAKYNLNVGNNKNPDIEEGIQHESVIGWNNQGKTKYGDIYFSENYYWDNNGLKPEYGTEYPAYVYDSNSNSYEYIENYINKLKTNGVINITGRLITHQELVDLGCNSKCNSDKEWLYSTSYWTGTASAERTLWAVLTNSSFGRVGYMYNRVGVRPVIEVPTSDIL